MDNAFHASWRPSKGDRFNIQEAICRLSTVWFYGGWLKLAFRGAAAFGASPATRC